MRKRKAIKAVVSAFAIGAATLPLGESTLNGTSEKHAIVAYESSSGATSFTPSEFNKYSKIMYSDTSSSHINIDEMKIIINESKNFNDDIMKQFISLIQSDKEDDDSFEASRFIEKQYALNSNMCIKMLESAFKMQSYKFAHEVISAIRFSDIDYFNNWYKNLLISGRQQPKLTDYINALFDLYREEFDTL